MLNEEDKQHFLDEDAHAKTIGLLIETIEDTDDPIATARAILTVMGTDLKALDAEIAEWHKEVRARWAFRDVDSSDPN